MFHPDAAAIGARKVAICREFGFAGLFPLEGVGPPGERADRRIFRDNMASMRSADAGVFNLTPFRGASADVGTVFELGAFVGMGKPVFGYSDDGRDLLTRVAGLGPVRRGAAGAVDADGMAVEDFGNADNLMITEALAESGVGLLASGGASGWSGVGLEGFRRCLAAVAAIMGAGAAGVRA